MQDIKSYINQNKDRFVNELIDLLKIPSISADAAYKNDVLKTADTVKSALEKAGCDAVEICEKAIDFYPESYGAKKCNDLLHTITKKTINIELAKCIKPNTIEVVNSGNHLFLANTPSPCIK